jgi:hypothetical protein
MYSYKLSSCNTFGGLYCILLFIIYKTETLSLDIQFTNIHVRGVSDAAKEFFVYQKLTCIRMKGRYMAKN